MIPENQIRRYIKKSGDQFISEGNIESNEHGFCVWGINGEKLVLINVFWDGVYWDEWSVSKARELKMKSIFIATKRSHKAYTKKYNYNVVGYVLEKGV